MMKETKVVIEQPKKKKTIPLKIVNKDKEVKKGTTDCCQSHCQGGGGW